MPNSTHGSVAYLTTIAALIIIGGYVFNNLPNLLTNHSAEASAMVEVEEEAREGLTPTAAPQNKAVVETKPSLAVTVEEPKQKYTSEQEEIIAFIKQTFGKDSDNAIKIAKCESGLRPNAVNDNTTWGGRGIDKGLFQINTSWQGVTNDNFLYDYKINTLMAKTIFDSWGHNFQAWTCGKKLGI